MTAENSARSTSAATLYIDGAWRAAALGREFDVFNPADGSVLGAASDGSASEARSAVDSAAAAFAGGRARPPTSGRRPGARPRVDAGAPRGPRQADDQGAGQAAAAARNEVALRRGLPAAGSPRRPSGSTAQTIPSARADQRLPGACISRSASVAAITPWNYPVSMLTRKVGTGPRRRMHGRAQAGRADAAVRRRGRSRCFDEVGLPAGVVNLVTTDDPAPVGDELLDQPGGPQADVHRLDRGRQAAMAQAAPTDEAGVDGARRPRPVHRLRRRRPGRAPPRARPGEVPQHRPGVHLPQPALRAARHRRRRSSRRWSGGSARCRPATASTDGVHHRPADRRGRHDKMERQVRDAVGQGRHGRDRRRAAARTASLRRRPVLRPDRPRPA